MIWLTIIGIVVGALGWLLSLLKNSKPGDVPPQAVKRLANAAYLCSDVVLEANRLGVQPEAPDDPPAEARPTAPFPTDVASMRAYLAESFDRLLGLPRLLLGADDRRIVYASQSHWQAASDAEVLDLLNRIPPG